MGRKDRSGRGREKDRGPTRRVTCRGFAAKFPSAYWPAVRSPARIAASPFAGALPPIRPPRADRGVTGMIHADDQPVDSQAACAAALQAEAPGHARMPAEARRVLAGQNDDTEEAELGFAED